MDYLVMMLCKPNQLWKSRNKKAVHCMAVIGHESGHRPEGVLCESEKKTITNQVADQSRLVTHLFVHIHEQKSGNLGHALAISDFLVQKAVKWMRRCKNLAIQDALKATYRIVDAISD